MSVWCSGCNSHLPTFGSPTEPVTLVVACCDRCYLQISKLPRNVAEVRSPPEYPTSDTKRDTP